MTPVTQRDIAQACGVHPSTICLALRDSPSLPEATRRRIQTTARRLGYQLNAAARNLAWMRTDKHLAASLPLAWINQESDPTFWQTHPQGRRAFAGARQRAAELGYHLDEFWLRERGMTARRLAQIIQARGIPGLIFATHGSFDPELLLPIWGEFATVALNDHRASDWFDMVGPDYYHNIGTALDQLHRQGFRRIGLVLSAEFDASTSGLARSGYLRHQAELALADRLPVCLMDPRDRHTPSACGRWSQENRPDAVVTNDARFAAWFDPSHREIEVASLQCATPDASSGIDEQPGEVAALAVECVARKVQQFIKGVGGCTQRHLIKGVWQARPAAKVAAAAAA